MTTPSRRWTTDLLVTLLGTILATAAVLVGPGGSLLRVALVVPLVVFLPGYALVAALVPARNGDVPSTERTVRPPGRIGGGLDPATRIGLSIAASIAILPAVVFAISAVTGGIHPIASGLVLAAITTVLTVVALLRRWRLPSEDRLAFPSATGAAQELAGTFRIRERDLTGSSTFTPTTRRGLLLNVALAGSVLAFVGTIAGAYALPIGNDGFTELYLTTKTADGDFVADDYPNRLVSGETTPVYATIANHENEPTTYSLVVRVQQVRTGGNETRVLRQQELLRATREVGAGEQTRIETDLKPAVAGDRLRVQYLLYVGDAPENPDTDSAYRSLHLWVAVDRSGGA